MRIVARPGRLEVVDDGPGIAEADLGRAFERFYLYDRYEGERRVGTGLGLAIVRELVEAMDGAAEVRSERGAGATVSKGAAADLADAELPLKERVNAYERALVVDALQRARGNQSEAARLLRTSRATLQYKMKLFSI